MLKMFYEKNLMTSKSLSEVWRAGNYLYSTDDEENPMPFVCDNLNSWVSSDHEEVHERLALRTSAVLINGAARLYKRKIQQLLEDIQRLDIEMTFPKRSRFWLDIDSDTSSLQLDTNDTLVHSDTFEQNESTQFESNGEFSSLVNDQHTQEDYDAIKVDKQVQTDLVRPTETHEEFDKTLPFGFVVIHDNYYSRIPSKIIISSFNPDIGKLA